MKKILYTFLLFQFLSGQTSNRPSYIWPTNASKNLTSVFAEFRPRHYHSGIDIKTWAREGYKVFAIADGYVSRIRVSPFGYGKALYLKLKDGNYQVVAHLQRFSDEIEKRVRKKQIKNGRFSVEIFPQPNEFIYKKGQLIAFSGSTGIGVPHLHFEIRNAQNIPQNPLLYYPQLKDTIVPEISQIALLPLSDSSWINGRALKALFHTKSNGRGKYFLSNTIYANGPFALSFVAWDKANDVYNKFSIFRFKFFKNDSLIFSAVYDKFNFDDTRFIELDRNFALIREKKGKFQQILLHRENKLPFYKTNKEKGTLIVAPGEILNLRLEVEDYNGNQSQAVIKVFGIPPIILNKANLVKYKDVYLARFNNFFSPSKWRLEPLGKTSGDIRFYSSDAKIWNVLFIRPIGTFSFASESHQVKIPLTFNNLAISEDLVKNVVIDKDILRVLTKSKSGFNLSDYIEIKFDSSRLSAPDSRYNKSLSTQLKLPHKDGNLIALLKNRSRSDTLFHNEIYFVSPKQSREILTSKIKLKFPGHSFYDDAFVYMDYDYPKDAKVDKHILGNIINVEPFLQPINMGASVSLPVPDSLKGDNRVALFYKSDKDKWVFLSANEKGFCSSKVLSLEKFALKIDKEVPVISSLTIKKKNIQRLPKFFKWSATDQVSGFKGDEGFKGELDGETIILEYDPEEDLLILPTFDLHINKGPHQFKIYAVDNVGNQTVHIDNFILK